MAYLFTSQTPVSGDVNEAQPVTVAITVYFTVAGTVTGGRFYAPATVSGTFSLAFWQLTSTTTGTLLGTSADYSSVTPSVWNATTLTSGVAVAVNTPYVMGLRSSIGRYTATNNGLQSAGITNGNIVAPQTGTNPLGGFTINNGTFASNSTSAFPSGTFNGGLYFVEPDFTPAADVTAPSVPTGLATTTVGATSASFSWTASTDNIGVTGYELQVIGA